MKANKFKKNVFFLLFSLLFILSRAGFAEDQGSFYGRVTDAQGVPLAGVKITVLSYTGDVYRVKTNKNGEYRIENLKPDIYDIFFHLFGYIPQHIVVTLETNAPHPLNVILQEYTIEQLMQMEVTSATRQPESLLMVPATMIVLTAEDIEIRGYRDISEVLADLPGMELIRPYGDTFLKNYWRGFRNTIGEPFLVMLDGLILNHLYFNTADSPLISLPLSSIDRIEIVYGPASATYGANAFRGIINIITKKADTEHGSNFLVRLSTGADANRLVDAWGYYRGERFSFMASIRYLSSKVNTAFTDEYEYAQTSYLKSRALWGGFLDNPNIGGNTDSDYQAIVYDLRLTWLGTTIGFLGIDFRTGYGYQYPTDRALRHGLWSKPDAFLYVKHSQTFGNFSSNTLIGRHWSTIEPESFFVEGMPDVSDHGKRKVDFSYWQSLNDSFFLYEDVELVLTPSLVLGAGLKYEWKDLQKAYDVTYGPTIPPSGIDASTYPYPAPPQRTPQQLNRIQTEDIGGYLNIRYSWKDFLIENSTHLIHLGVRYDHNSKYGSSPTVRFGYVGSFQNEWVIKFLYGEAYQEPVPRVLYGGWKGSGSDPNLGPEKSRTYEFSLSWTRKTVHTLFSLYAIQDRDTIVTTTTGAQNLGKRSIIGMDLHFQYQLSRKVFEKLLVWLYFNTYFKRDELKIDAFGNSLGMGRVGDLADYKLTFGITAYPSPSLALTFKGRWIGPRHTVDTNPARKVNGYFIADFHTTLRNFLDKGVGFSLTVQNIFNVRSFHPGVREADAGLIPGTFLDPAQTIWAGSEGWYSSLLPQPGRRIYVTVSFQYP